MALADVYDLADLGVVGREQRKLGPGVAHSLVIAG